MSTTAGSKKLIAVIGATGQQGGGVVRALQAGGQFEVRALSRNPDKHRDLADEVVEGDLDRPETLKAAFEGAHGVFLVTNFWERRNRRAQAGNRGSTRCQGCRCQTLYLVNAAECRSDQRRQVQRSPLYRQGQDRSDSEGGRVCVSHVRHRAFLLPESCGRSCSAEAGRRILGWALPLDPEVRCIHMGDIRELGNIVAGAFAHPDEAGNGEYLPLVGDFMSFNEIVETLNRQGHEFSFKQVPTEVFAAFFPGAAEIAEMFSYFQAHTYLGSDSSDRIALANKIAGRQPSKFSAWARANFSVRAA